MQYRSGADGNKCCWNWMSGAKLHTKVTIKAVNLRMLLEPNRKCRIFIRFIVWLKKNFFTVTILVIIA